MYLILREDLAYKYIQGAHALSQFALNHPEQFVEWNNQYLICLSVFNGLALRDIAEMLFNNEVLCSAFIEPDLESKLPTAIALFDDGKNNYRKYLSNLQLATK